MMRRYKNLVAVLIVAALLAGCRGLATVTPVVTVDPPILTATAVGEEATAEPQATPVPTEATDQQGDALREVVILFTNDEHGYLEPTESGTFYQGGAAFAASSWLREGYDPFDPTTHTLLISGGDNWTGPAISTWFGGESSVEVMTAMGYSSSIIGNHEFDFGQDVLRTRLGQAEFPYLGANLLRAGTDEIADLVQPYMLVDVNGVKLAVIGLVLESTPSVTAIKNLDGLEFGSYEAALRKWVPVVRAEGAQIVIVAAHVPAQDLVLLADQVEDLGIAAFLGGHQHLARNTRSGGALVASGGGHWEDYVVTTFTYDLAREELVSSEQSIVDVLSSKSGKMEPQPEVAAVISKWSDRAGLILGETIGYTATGLEQHSEAMHSVLVESWLWSVPDADLAMSNTGGYREGIAPGDITLAEIVAVFPFENELYEIELTGEQFLEALSKTTGMVTVGGIVREGEEIRLRKDGSLLVPDRVYRLLVTDYMYGNSKYPFGSYDAEPYEVGISWRQPVIDWVGAHKSDQVHPLEEYISAAWN